MARKKLTRTDCERVDRMRLYQTDREIADAFRVTTRTLRDSCGTRADWESSRVNGQTRSDPALSEWQKEWTADFVAAQTGLDLEMAGRVVAGAMRAQAVGDLAFFEFCCRWVGRADDQAAPEPWAAFLAGLPLLASVWSMPAFSLIHGLILEHKPYVPGGRLDDVQAAVVLGYPVEEDSLTPEIQAAAKAYEANELRYRKALELPVRELREAIEVSSYNGLFESDGFDDFPYSSLMGIVDKMQSARGVKDSLAQVLGQSLSDEAAHLFRLFARALIGDTTRKGNIR